MKSFSWRNLLVPMFAAAVGGTGASLSGADVSPFVTEIGALVGVLAGLLFNKVGSAVAPQATNLSHPQKERGFIHPGVMLVVAVCVLAGAFASHLGFVSGEGVAFLVSILIAVVLSVFVVRTAWTTRPDARQPASALRYVDVYAAGHTSRGKKRGAR